MVVFIGRMIIMFTLGIYVFYIRKEIYFSIHLKPNDHYLEFNCSENTITVPE